MSTRTETIGKAVREWLCEQGYIREEQFDANAPLGLDSFAYLAFIIYLEDRFEIEVKADLFFERDLWEEEETFASLCRRLERSVVESVPG